MAATERASSTSFRAQADALLRKNLLSQKRKMMTNLCLIGFPVVLCVLLVLFQMIINKILSGPSHSCGCICAPANGTSICKKKCGVEYSTPTQAAFCAISQPPQWPAVLQVPAFQYRAVDDHESEFPGLPDISCRWVGSCPASFLYTGNNRSVSDELASGLFSSSIPTNTSDFLSALSELVPGTIYGIASSNYIEPAFLSGRFVYILQPDCSNFLFAYQLYLNSLLSIPSSSVNVSTAIVYTCLETLLLWRDNYTYVNQELYQGYHKGNPTNMINEISAAFDFGNTSMDKFDVTIWYNNSMRSPSTTKPPGLVRLPRAMNLAAQAFLRWRRGPNAELLLLFVSEMPKPATTLRLEFSSLLGPLFFMWVTQLLFPVIISTLVYEKQQKLRVMMKMHGLGDGTYFIVTYFFFFLLSVIYMTGFVMFGSLIAAFFSNATSATVVGYLYVFGFGLLGASLFQFFVEDKSFNKGALVLMEILPGFALFRGFYELSQYALTGYYQGTKGMRWANLKDRENGMRGVFTIMLVEWIILMPVGYYKDTTSFRNKGFWVKILKEIRTFFTRSSVKILDSHVNDEMQKPDVLQEKLLVKEILSTNASTYPIVCDDLRKVYPGKDGTTDKHAVQGISFAVPLGQCFGMLGPNGAGKTSSLNMMIGLSNPTSGTAYIQGLDIKKDIDKIHLVVGVCPQYDLLWETLTGREHLLFYGRLKNLKGSVLGDAVLQSLRSVNLLSGGVANKLVGTYSGGMKRRLSVAISLIGDPKHILCKKLRYSATAWEYL